METSGKEVKHKRSSISLENTEGLQGAEIEQKTH